MSAKKRGRKLRMAARKRLLTEMYWAREVKQGERVVAGWLKEGDCELSAARALENGTIEQWMLTGTVREVGHLFRRLRAGALAVRQARYPRSRHRQSKRLGNRLGKMSARAYALRRRREFSVRLAVKREAQRIQRAMRVPMGKGYHWSTSALICGMGVLGAHAYAFFSTRKSAAAEVAEIRQRMFGDAP